MIFFQHRYNKLNAESETTLQKIISKKIFFYIPTLSLSLFDICFFYSIQIFGAHGNLFGWNYHSPY